MGMDLPLGAVQRQIASGIDIIVHLGRLRDKSRKVLEVSEILDYQDGEILVSPLYRFEETGEKEAFFAKPKTEYGKLLLDSVPTLPYLE